MAAIAPGAFPAEDGLYGQTKRHEGERDRTEPDPERQTRSDIIMERVPSCQVFDIDGERQQNGRPKQVVALDARGVIHERSSYNSIGKAGRITVMGCHSHPDSRIEPVNTMEAIKKNK